MTTQGHIQKLAMLALLFGGLSLFGGCYAGYAGAVSGMHQAIDQGQMSEALLYANEALGVDAASQLPATVGDDTALLLLERAVLLQSLGRHKEAARDFAEADKSLEVLDLSEDSAGDVGKWLFSDDSGLYKAPPHEKLLVNSLAMVSYLAEGDLDGAKVEARRLTVLQKYFQDAAPEEIALFGVGSYLAGFAHEKAGDRDAALRYYIEAFDKGGFDGVSGPIVYLGQQTGFEHDIVGQAKEYAPGATPPGDNEGEILVVIQNGRAPYKEAERLPIGAFVVQPVANARWRMTPKEQAQADRVVAEGLLKWISFPVLYSIPPRLKSFNVRVGGRSAGAPHVSLDVEEATIAAWENDKGKLMFAAFTRMVTRAIAGEVAEAVGKGSNMDKSLFPGASLLLGAVVEGGMAAADTPDTRSWTTMPAGIIVYRMRVPAGEHTVNITGEGRGRGRSSETVNVRAGGYAVASFRFME